MSLVTHLKNITPNPFPKLRSMLSNGWARFKQLLNKIQSVASNCFNYCSSCMNSTPNLSDRKITDHIDIDEEEIMKLTENISKGKRIDGKLINGKVKPLNGWEEREIEGKGTIVE